MAVTEREQDAGIWDGLIESVQEELDQSRREQKEISLMLEQSQVEVNKLTQRNASVTAHLQQVQSQFESLPRAEIRLAYDSALDAQQRLFYMRSQLDKLQSDLTRLKRYGSVLERALQALESCQPTDQQRNGTLVETVEMIIQAQETERQRLSRQMHDGPAQALSNFILQTDIAMRLLDLDQAKAKEELASLKLSATNTFQKVRDFIFELRPMMLDDLGLIPTLKKYVEALKGQPGLDISLTVNGMEHRLDSYIEVMIFRAIQELLNNSLHDSLASQVNIQVDMGDNYVKVIVQDNGKGFNLLAEDDARNKAIKLIRDRVEMMGGVLSAESGTGQGSRISFQIPASSLDEAR